MHRTGLCTSEWGPSRGCGHWGWAAGGPSGSGATGEAPGFASSTSSSDATPSSKWKTSRTVRVVKVRGPRLWGDREAEMEMGDSRIKEGCL